MNQIEQNTTHFSAESIPKKCKQEAQNFGQARTTAGFHDVSDAGETMTAQVLQPSRFTFNGPSVNPGLNPVGLQQPSGGSCFNFNRLRNAPVKLQCQASQSKQKTYEYIRSNFQHLDETEIQNLLQEIKDSEPADENDSQTRLQSQLAPHQIKISDASKIAQRQMNRIQNQGQILNQHKVSSVQNKYEKYASNFLSQVDMPQRQQKQSSTMPQFGQGKVSKKRGYGRSAYETQQRRFDCKQQNPLVSRDQKEQEQNQGMPQVSVMQQQMREGSYKQIDQNQIQRLAQGQQEASASQIDQTDQSAHMMEIQQLRQNLIPCKDRFFYQLENNFSSYIHDRSAAYEYITRELQAYDDEALVTLHMLSKANQEQQSESTEVLKAQLTILKKGIQLFNKKFDVAKQNNNKMEQQLKQSQQRCHQKDQELAQAHQQLRENEHKVRNFDQMLSAYQKQAQELQFLRAQFFKLNKQSNSMTEPHQNNHGDFGGHQGDGFGGGVF